jgi:hypothetical protein
VVCVWGFRVVGGKGFRRVRGFRGFRAGPHERVLGLRGFTVDRRGLRRITCLRWAADADHNEICDQGAILGAGGFDAGFRWEKGVLLRGILVLFNQNSLFRVGMLIWPAERVGFFGSAGMKESNIYPIFVFGCCRAMRGGNV